MIAPGATAAGKRFRGAPARRAAGVLLVGAGLAVTAGEASSRDPVATEGGDAAAPRLAVSLLHPAGRASRTDSVTVAFHVPDPELIPEGIAYDPATRAFYVGSTWKRKIVRVDSTGRATDFTSEAQDGLLGVVGMDVNAERRILWAASSHAGAAMPMLDATSAEEGSSGLWGYGVDDGRLVARHLLEPSEGPSFLNDLAVARDGTVYVSDSRRNALYRLPPGGERLERFVDLAAFPNGLDFSADQRFLFVAQGSGIARVDLATREVLTLEKDPDVPLQVIDGLYVHEGDLVVVGGVEEDGARTWNVGRYELSPDGRRVVSGRDLLPSHPALRQPTTGVIVGDAIYVVANSHLQEFRALVEEGGKAGPGELLGPTILRVPLDPQADRSGEARTSAGRPDSERGTLRLMPPVGGACSAHELEVTYVANEGFLLSGGGQRVLIDALFRDGLGTYEVPEGELRADLEQARDDFAGVDVLLATHAHRDHFSAAAAARHLEADPGATLVVPPQAADSVRRVVPEADELMPRIRTRLPSPGRREAIEVAGVHVEALGLPHGPTPRPVDHVGWLVHVGGRSVVHLGDAEVDRDRYRALGLGPAGVDLALVGYWFLLNPDARAVVLEELRPRRLVAMHVDAGEAAGVAARVAEAVPAAWTPRRAGDRMCVGDS